jgi:hypothetical protein
MTSIITTCQSAGASVVLMAGIPSNTTAATNGTLSGFTGALVSLALKYNCPMISLPARWTSYTVTNPIMPYFPDGVHGTAQGYSDVALAMFELLSRP